MAGGRPTKYNKALVNKITELIHEGESIAAIARMPDMPSHNTLHRWLNEHPEFRDSYELARDLREEKMFQDILEISDDGHGDQYETEDGRTVTNNEVIARSRLRVDTRKWMLARMNPRKYSDKTILSGDQDNPIRTVNRIEVAFIEPDPKD